MRNLFLALLVLSACEKKQEVTPVEIQNEKVEKRPQLPPNDQLYWILDSDSLTKQKNPQFSAVNLQEDSVISVLNQKFEQTTLQKVKKSSDTLYVQIPNPQFFTNQMGSMGAGNYMANVVLNLVAVPGISFINLDFEEGSHASPGVYSEKDFWTYKEKP